MLSTRTTRKVKFATFERGTAWIVVAFLVEIRGTETRVISGPRIVKIIQKNRAELPAGKKSSAILALSTPICQACASGFAVTSPFFSTVFGFTSSEFIAGLAARPPTF